MDALKAFFHKIFHQKHLITSLLIIYVLSYLLHSVFFAQLDLFAREDQIDNTNIVAVFVDEAIYDDIESDVRRYTSQYIQGKVSNSKAIVFPINTDNYKARDIAQMLENMYFDGLEDETSTLLGTILIGDIPLPVVEYDNFIYPSIYPYVDFIDQQFIFDGETQYFTYNDQPNGEAEIRHGLLNFGDNTTAYQHYFSKLQTYNADPDNFVSPKIWYDDFIALKKYLNTDEIDYYTNNFLFTEDVNYQRYNQLMLDLLQGNHNDKVANIASDFRRNLDMTQQGNDDTDSRGPEFAAFNQALDDYAANMEDLAAEANNAIGETAPTTVPTLTLERPIKELMYDYQELIGQPYRARVRDNVQAGGRRYVNQQQVDTHFKKITLKDTHILGHDDTDKDAMLVLYNNQLEELWNQTVEDNDYYMTVPVPITYKYGVEKKGPGKCEYQETIYENFYHGTKATQVDNPNKASIYRGTYQNLTGLDDTDRNDRQGSLGSTYDIFSIQTEANRGYNANNASAEYVLRSGTKIQLNWKEKCDPGNGLPGIKLFGICFGQRDRETQNKKCELIERDDEGERIEAAKDAKESQIDYAMRQRGGASPINLNESLKLKIYIPDYARLPVYDIAGSKKLDAEQADAYDYAGYTQFASLIKTQDRAGEFLYPRCIEGDDQAILFDSVPIVAKDTKDATDPNIDFFTMYPKAETGQAAGKVFTLIYDQGDCTFASLNASDYEKHTVIYQTKDTRAYHTAPTPDQLSGMNITTPDRPIDNIRYMTMLGVGGDTVRFDYPNLYEVGIYTQDGNKITLKSVSEIEEAIVDYLRNKGEAYRDVLETQLEKNQSFYSTNTAAYNLLKSDKLATPDRTYTLPDADIFVDALDQGTIEEIAYLLWYQSSLSQERRLGNTVIDDLNETRTSIDINHKIAHTMEQYLTEDNDQGGIITPGYNTDGYEVAYINSDGFDYIQRNNTPAFIESIQQQQNNYMSNNEVEFASTEQGSPVEEEINNECQVDPAGTVPIRDRPEAFKCWLQITLEKPLEIRFDRSNAQGPVIGNQNAANIQDGTEQQREVYDNSWQQITNADQQNQETIDNLPPQQAATMQEVLQYTVTKTNESSRYVDPAQNQEKEIRITSLRDVGDIAITITATGDNCLATNGTNDLCTDPYTTEGNFFNEPLSLPITLPNKTAGETVISVELCQIPDVCVIKTTQVNLLPGQIDDIVVTTPTDVVMQNAQLPILVEGYDQFDNPLGQILEEYTISVSTGRIVGNSAGGNAIAFSHFGDSQFTYYANQAPHNTTVAINITPTATGNSLPTATKDITIVQGNLSIDDTANIDFTPGRITYALPDSKTDIVYTDTTNTQQYNVNNMPRIQLDLTDQSGRPLEARAHISSDNQLLAAGTITSRTLTTEQNGVTQTVVQQRFQRQTNMLIENGSLTIYLNPSFTAGDDTITIEVQGIEPITIDINVLPGPARKINLQLDRNSADINIPVQGSLTITDLRDNIITTPTDITLGAIGPVTIGDEKDTIVTVPNGKYNFAVMTTEPGGAGYIYATINGVGQKEQFPGYASLIVQQGFVPQDDLNVMYLNLFGTDWGNQRGYFSDNDQKIPHIINSSDTLLAATTQLIDPSKLKESVRMLTENGQVHNIDNNTTTLATNENNIIVGITNIGHINIGNTNEYNRELVDDISIIDPDNIGNNTIAYIPNPTDSFITQNTLNNNTLRINNTVVWDIDAGNMDSNLTITATDEKHNGLTVRQVRRGNQIVGQLFVRRADGKLTNNLSSRIDITNVAFDAHIGFSAGSTNAPHAISIYRKNSTFSPAPSYESVENTDQIDADIGFRGDMKHISNFAAGQAVGDATKGFASMMSINFGDPLLTRIDRNAEKTHTDFDGGLGKAIYTDPNKTILKTIPVDFNNDELKDIIVAYTDGSVRLLKNYGGTNPYKDMQNLMLIAVGIDDIFVGDVDGNEYMDIIIRTTDNRLRTYLNDEGILDVDGLPVCLDVADGPNDISGIRQLFVEDMDLDGAIDIITNDTRGDIKIFYGGETDNHPNYLSTLAYTCDDARQERIDNNTKLVKSFAIKLDEDRKILDSSLLHWDGLTPPGNNSAIADQFDDLGGNNDTSAIDAITELFENGDITAEEFQERMKAEMEKNGPAAGVSNFDPNTLLNHGATELLRYVPSPIEQKPIYDDRPLADMFYIPLQYLTGSDDAIAYKQYTDINGDILMEGDIVTVKVTLEARDDNTFTFIDKVMGPRGLQRRTNNKISSLSLTGLDNDIVTNWKPAGSYTYIIDNITLDDGDTVSRSYEMTYQGGPLIDIDVLGINDDEYLDIQVSPADACTLSMWQFTNEEDRSDAYRSYDEAFVDIQKQQDEYRATQQKEAQNRINDVTNTINDATANQDLSNIPGMEDLLADRSPKDIFQDLTEDGQLNFNLDMSAVDTATAGIEAQLDQALNGLCQGFKIGGCQGLPMPFNMAFLSPGTYNIMGCALMPDKGLPVFFFPGTMYTPGGPVPIPYGQKGPGDSFYRAPGGSYPSQIRIYASPTLTMQLGIAICLGPMSAGEKIPKPFRDMGGNCIVTTVGLPCGNDTQDPTETEVLNPRMKDLQGKNSCSQPTNIAGYATTDSDEYSTAPYQLVSAGDGSNNFTRALPASFRQNGIINFDQEPVNFTDLNESVPGNVQLKAGPEIDLKIKGGGDKGLAQCIIHDRLDRQIKYTMNNLTKMSIGITFPDMTTLLDGFDTLNTDTLSSMISQENQTDIQQTPPVDPEDAGKLNAVIQNNRVQQQDLQNMSHQISNPFDAISTMFNEVELINVNTKDINIKIPLVYSEDILKYSNYLQVRLQDNKAILEERQELFQAMIGFCGSIVNLSNAGDIQQKVTQLQQTLPDAISSTRTQLNRLTDQRDIADNPEDFADDIKTLEKQLEKNQSCIDFFGSVQIQQFVSFQENSAQLVRSVRQNINTLNQYKKFPLQLYERIHVTDRYLTELSAIISDFVGSITYRMNTNAQRFSSYVDTIVLMIGSIKTRQALIDFSVNWSERCSSCTNDNYDYYSCSLSLICPKLPVLPVPPFKIPNIFIDLSHIDVGIDILLPNFNFTPTQIALPQLPDLPSPPTYNFNVDVGTQLDIGVDLLANIDVDFGALNVPAVPILPAPPELPELPSFLPSVKMDLPVLPPAPQIPDLVPEIQASITAAEFVGKVMCITKGGIGLVGEQGVKSKIEQISQRTWNVPIFDELDQTLQFQDPPLQGFDYKIDAYVQLQYNFSHVYQLIDSVAAQVNSVSSKAEGVANQSVRSLTEELQNSDTNQSIQQLQNGPSILNEFDRAIDDLNSYIPAEETDTVPYRTAFTKLRQGLQFFRTKIDDSGIKQHVTQLLSIVESDHHVTPATQSVLDAHTQVETIIDNKQQHIRVLADQVKHDYDQFLDDINTNNIQLVSDKKQSLSITTPLRDVDQQTKTLIAQQEHPSKTYLSMHQEIADGYTHALQNNSPEMLNMDQATHTKALNYMTNLQTKLATTNDVFANDTANIQSASRPAPTMQIAQNTTNTTNNTSSASSFSTNLGQYVNGIYIDAMSGDEEVVVNVINSEKNYNTIENNWMLTDVNQDDHDDILMRDSNTIYVKYRNQEDETDENITRQNHVGNYYVSELLDDPENNKNDSNDGYVRIDDMILKLYDTHREVKNFAMQGQDFDSISFGWTNNTIQGDQPGGYVIRLNHRVDTFADKYQIVDTLGPEKVHHKYVIMLPENTDYTGNIIDLEDTNIRATMESLLTGTVYTINYYDPAEIDMTTTIYELPRNWQYAQIATLRATDNVYEITSPRSNQIVAGTQIITDDEGPDPTITLHRPMTSEIIDTGINFDGYVSTNYELHVQREDNLAVSGAWITYNNQTIVQTNTGTSQLTGLFYTGELTNTFMFGAVDVEGNETRQPVNLNIAIPDIDIVDIQKINDTAGNVIARISHDLDQGTVSFQRQRNKQRTTLTGTRDGITQDAYELLPKQVIITGGVYDMSDNIGLYLPAGDQIGTINPHNGQILIDPTYQSQVETSVDFLSHIPMIKLTDIQANQSLFQIYLPPNNMITGSIQITNGLYQTVPLGNNFGSFSNGQCIKPTNGDCILYISAQGHIYAPQPYNAQLTATYRFNPGDETITYTIVHNQTTVGTITIKTKSLLEK